MHPMVKVDVKSKMLPLRSLHPTKTIAVWFDADCTDFVKKLVSKIIKWIYFYVFLDFITGTDSLGGGVDPETPLNAPM